MYFFAASTNILIGVLIDSMIHFPLRPPSVYEDLSFLLLPAQAIMGHRVNICRICEQTNISHYIAATYLATG